MDYFFGKLSLTGFLDGITATGIIVSCVIFGLFSFYKAKKLEAKLLSFAGLNMVFVGCLWLGPATDFFSVLLTGYNLNPYHLYGWLSYVWVLPASITGYYIGGELMFPEKKKIVVGIYTVISGIFVLLIFIMPTEVFDFSVEKGGLIDSGFKRTNLAYWLILFLQFSIIGLLTIGYAIKAKQASGEIRKKFIYLAIGSLIFFICGMFDSTLPPGPYLAAWRGAMMTYSLWFYLGLKT